MTDTTEPLVPLPPDEPHQLSPTEIRHRKNSGAGGLDAMIPFHVDGHVWRPAPVPADMFGVPHCPRCLYYHRTEEPCQR